jgi:glutathione reductase (NADPH)
MPERDFDLFVIGGGSGGVRAARIAASHGARVAIAEEYRYGGTCVIRGCVPKKLFVYAAHYRRDLEDAVGYGWDTGAPSFDWNTLLANKDAEIDRLNKIYIQLLKKHGVEVLHGRARLRDRHTIEIGDRTVTAHTILVATGGTPFKADIPGAELAISSNEAFHLEALPKRMAVAGGGYIAVEFAHIFAGLGVEVLLVHRRHRVLRGFDIELRKAVTDGLAHAGVELHMDVVIDRIARTDGGGRRIHLTDGGELDVDVVMGAMGRVPMTAGIGLEEVGVELGPRGGVIVDDFSQSSVDNIYAVGDCTDRIQLTPVAIREGHAFADSVFGNSPRPIDHTLIPTAIFAQPAAATVGLTEEAALERGPVAIYEADFRPMKHTLSGRNERVYMKLVVDRETDRVVGCHMVADEAPEIIQAIAIAIRAGATKADFDATTALHPTTAEELVLMRTPTRTPDN